MAIPLASIVPSTPPVATPPAAPAAAPKAPAAPTPTQPVKPLAATPEAAPKPVGFVVRHNHADVELSPEDARKFAQIGMKAAKLDERAAQLKAQEDANARYVQAGQLLEETMRRDPRAYEAIKNAVAGIYSPPPSAGDDGDDGLTAQPTARSVPSEVEQRLLRIESALHQNAQTLHQRDTESRLSAALNRPFLRAIPEAGEMARTMVPVIAAEQGIDLDAAAVVAESRLKTLIGQHQESERQAREERREMSPVPSQNGAPPFPRIDPSKATYGALKNGELRSAAKELYAKWKGITAGPQT